jgi:hypothetical protein
MPIVLTQYNNMDISGLFQRFSPGNTIVTTGVCIDGIDLGTLFNGFAGNPLFGFNTNVFSNLLTLDRIVNTGSLVRDGLVCHYDFTNTFSYPGSGSDVRNLVSGIVDASLNNNPVFQSSTSTMHFVNTDGTYDGSNNIQFMRTMNEISFRTVSIWYKQLTIAGNSVYLFDGRPKDPMPPPSRGGYGKNAITMEVEMDLFYGPVVNLQMELGIILHLLQIQHLNLQLKQAQSQFPDTVTINMLQTLKLLQY